MTKKKRGRIRQTRTEWQKVFDPHPGMIQSFSWTDRLPELLHISIALVDNDYNIVKSDFHRIADFVNARHKLSRRFHFNLSHTIKLIKEDKSILNEIFKTAFKNAFHQILAFYSGLLKVQIDFEIKPNVRSMLIGYKQILEGRSDTAILCKYMMVQYEHNGRPDPFELFNMNKKDEILKRENVSKVMSIFPPSVGSSENMDLEFCQDVWMFNYIKSPLMPKPDDSAKENEHYSEMKIDELASEFRTLYSDFKKLNLVAIYPAFIAEINMGFAARISNLSLDAVDFVKNHKGEVAELTFRTVLENFIVGSWLLLKKDIELHTRFREYSTGRERFFGEKLMEQTSDKKMKKEANRIINDAIKEAGVREIDVATERGDIFDLRIDQMAEEVWGKDNMFYFLYKRTSEVVHGQWRVIAKYHLAKSHNPMHNGLYWYNENTNRFAGLIPAFTCLGIATKFLLTILKDIKSNETKKLNKDMNNLNKKIDRQWMVYYKKYIQRETED
jgi:hypothetical protein